MEISGKIKLIGETETVGSAGTFKKRLIVISTDEQYVQHVPVDFVQDKTSILDKYQVGQEVKVYVNVRGNEYNGKYYVSLNGWRIESLTTAAPQQQASAPTPQAHQTEDDDLPF